MAPKAADQWCRLKRGPNPDRFARTRITPVIKVVHVHAPTLIETDVAHFRELVQALTGNGPAGPSPDNNHENSRDDHSPASPIKRRHTGFPAQTITKHKKKPLPPAQLHSYLNLDRRQQLDADSVEDSSSSSSFCRAPYDHNAPIIPTHRGKSSVSASDYGSQGAQYDCSDRIESSCIYPEQEEIGSATYSLDDSSVCNSDYVDSEYNNIHRFNLSADCCYNPALMLTNIDFEDAAKFAEEHLSSWIPNYSYHGDDHLNYSDQLLRQLPSAAILDRCA